MTTLSDAVPWFNAGFTPLVCIVPPDAILAPDSRIHVDARGKVPGKLRNDKTWAGYAWRTTRPSEDDVRQWVRDGANIGLNTETFPAVDIDVSDPVLAGELDMLARNILGDAPCRTGRHPKRLLLYRCSEPFTRGRMTIISADASVKHLVEVLGQGQQFVALGTHPATRQPYVWTPALPNRPEALTEIRADDVRMYFATVKELLESRGWTCRIDGAGTPMDPNQSSEHLRAPSFTALADAVAHIPNTTALFPSRDAYLMMGYAIKAAATPEQEEDAYSLYLEWASRWDGGANDPGIVRDDWRRVVPPYRVGWNWIAEHAKSHGYDDAANDFTPTDEAHVTSDGPSPLFGTDHWLAEQVIRTLGNMLRYAPELDRWYVWDGSVWAPNAVLQAEAMVNRQLIVLADKVSRIGATVEDRKKHYKLAETFLSSARASSVRKVMESDPALAIGVASFDSDPWLLNTPNGLVDLRTGTLKPADPRALASKRTAVAPEFDRECPVFTQFLKETTGDDDEFIQYLQRFAGYCLTGLTIEQCLLYVWGAGGNGKSVFLNVLSGILSDYARTASGEVFTHTLGERHSTEIAMLAGSRLVVASEIEYGKKWNQVRVKSLTGGEPISARFMRQDNFTFTPTFKILIAGNARPSIQNLDVAMRRRLHFVPFTRTPAKVDPLLGDKLRGEFPAILAWMIRGCLLWQQESLGMPSVVVGSTASYFEDEDVLQEWMRQTLEPVSLNEFTGSRALYNAWLTYCRTAGEDAGHERDLIQKLSSLGLVRGRKSGERGFFGLRIKAVNLADFL